MKTKIIRVWCWIVGHDWLCIYRDKNDSSQRCAYKCVRCGELHNTININAEVARIFIESYLEGK